MDNLLPVGKPSDYAPLSADEIENCRLCSPADWADKHPLPKLELVMRFLATIDAKEAEIKAKDKGIHDLVNTMEEATSCFKAIRVEIKASGGDYDGEALVSCVRRILADSKHNAETANKNAAVAVEEAEKRVATENKIAAVKNIVGGIRNDCHSCGDDCPVCIYSSVKAEAIEAALSA